MEGAAEELASRAERVVLAAMQSAEGRADALLLAAIMLLAVAANRMGDSDARRDDLLMLGEHLARQAAERLGRTEADGA